MKKRVIIIGAGVCGLTCARELSKFSKDIDLVILEASDRIGGRICSYTTDDGTVLELGAHYIHGTINNPIFNFAVDKGIIKKEDDNKGSVKYFGFSLDLEVFLLA